MAQIYTYSGVIVHFNPDCTDEFITHADYKALEEKYADECSAASALNAEVSRLAAELAELKDAHAQLAIDRFSLECELSTANEQHWKTLQELAECRKDAGRYQWLRESSKPGDGPAPALACQDGPYFNAPIHGEGLDRAIDKAIARSKA